MLRGQGREGAQSDVYTETVSYPNLIGTVQMEGG